MIPETNSSRTVLRVIAAVAGVLAAGWGIAAVNSWSVAASFARADALELAVEKQARGGMFLSLALVCTVVLVAAAWVERSVSDVRTVSAEEFVD